MRGESCSMRVQGSRPLHYYYTLATAHRVKQARKIRHTRVGGEAVPKAPGRHPTSFSSYVVSHACEEGANFGIALQSKRRE